MDILTVSENATVNTSMDLRLLCNITKWTQQAIIESSRSNSTLTNDNISQACTDDNISVTRNLGILKRFGFKSLFISIATVSVSLWLLVQLCRCRRLHTSINKLCGSLCVACLLNGILTLGYVWPYVVYQDHMVCLFFNCCSCTTFIVMFLHYMAISLERHILIVHPYFHARLTKNNIPVGLCLTTVWVISVILAFTPFFVTLRPGWRKICLQTAHVIPFWLYTLIYVGVLITATSTTAIAYYRIYRVVSRHVNAMEEQGKRPFHSTTVSDSISAKSETKNCTNNLQCDGHQKQQHRQDSIKKYGERTHYREGGSSSESSTNKFSQSQSGKGKESPSNFTNARRLGCQFESCRTDQLDRYKWLVRDQSSEGCNSSEKKRRSGTGKTMGKENQKWAKLEQAPGLIPLKPRQYHHQPLERISGNLQGSAITTIGCVSVDSKTKHNKENQADAVGRKMVKKTSAKFRSAVSFGILYVYYFMSWAPTTAIKTHSAYTNRIFNPLWVNVLVDTIVQLCPIGYCLLFMYLERDVRKITLRKICVLCRTHRVTSESASNVGS